MQQIRDVFRCHSVFCFVRLCVISLTCVLQLISGMDGAAAICRNSSCNSVSRLDLIVAQTLAYLEVWTAISNAA